MAGKHVPRPDYIHIINHTYEISWLNEDEWQQGHLDPDSDACTFASRQWIAIRLREGAHESHYQELLVHEATHAVWDVTMLTHAQIKDIPDPEEFIIGMQSPPFLFILQKNPEVTAWLTSDPNDIR